MYAKDVNDRRAREAQFKEIARDVARAHFSTTLPDGPWSYYEWMRDFRESGVYSKTATGPVVPETDTSTYNGQEMGSVSEYLSDEAEALAQYERVAIKPEFRWSWQNHCVRTRHLQLGTRTNEMTRTAPRCETLLLVGANHLFSMLDAFTTARLQVQPGPDGEHASRREHSLVSQITGNEACNCCSYHKLTSFIRRHIMARHR